jgi:hypothetical protein
MEKVEMIEKQQLQINWSKLRVSSYEKYYDGVPLHPEFIKQYQVDDDDLKHLLLSPGQDSIKMDMSVVQAVTEAWLLPKG